MKLVRISYVLICLSSLWLSSCHNRQQLGSSGKMPAESRSKTSALQKTYASLLGIQLDEITNIQLYAFIDDWTGTPYHYGGKTKEGIDCSGFTEVLYKTVFDKTITGSSRDLFEQCKVIDKEDLKEGDLLFFKIESEKVSHVGIYLANNKFVHATVKKGVMISDLGEAYYTKYYYKAGRLKAN